MRKRAGKGRKAKMRKMIQGYIWAKDKTHAIKIMNEKRTQAIANGEME